MSCENHEQGTNYQVLNELDHIGGITKDRDGRLIIGKIEMGDFPYDFNSKKINIDFTAIRLKSIFNKYNYNIPSGKQLTTDQIIKATHTIRSKIKDHSNYLSVLEKAVQNIATAFNRDTAYFNIWWLLNNDDKLLALANGKYSG